jgi:hypothetical protein
VSIAIGLFKAILLRRYREPDEAAVLAYLRPLPRLHSVFAIAGHPQLGVEEWTRSAELPHQWALYRRFDPHVNSLGFGPVRLTAWAV